MDGLIRETILEDAILRQDVNSVRYIIANTGFLANFPGYYDHPLHHPGKLSVNHLIKYKQFGARVWHYINKPFRDQFGSTLLAYFLHETKFLPAHFKTILDMIDILIDNGAIISLQDLENIELMGVPGHTLKRLRSKLTLGWPMGSSSNNERCIGANQLPATSSFEDYLNSNIDSSSAVPSLGNSFSVAQFDIMCQARYISMMKSKLFLFKPASFGMNQLLERFPSLSLLLKKELIESFIHPDYRCVLKRLPVFFDPNEFPANYDDQQNIYDVELSETEKEKRYNNIFAGKIGL